MPIVNYVREHIRFMEYATDEHLTSSERLLWYALMHIFNQRAQGNVWPDEFVRISNDRLLTFCPMKYDTLSAARNTLKQRGLIEYTKGEKNKLSPAYRMIYFYPQYIPSESENDAEGYPEKSDYLGGNMGGNPGGNMGGKSGGKSGGNSGDIILNYTKNKTIRNPDFEEDDEDAEDSRAYARAREEAARAWRISFGEDAYPLVLDRLARTATAMKFEDGVLTAAIRAAAFKGAKSPIDYIVTVLSDWYYQKIRTVEDADEYAFIFDAMKGRMPGNVTSEEGFEMARNFRQDRETAEERENREDWEDREEERRKERNAMIQANKENREKIEYEEERQRLDRRYGKAAGGM